MDAVIAWVAFVGSWLLFAGPVYQASLELQEEGLERDRFERVTAGVPNPEPISAWWWLLPPVRYVLERRRWKDHRRTMMTALTVAQRKQLIQYLNKTTGWLFVAFGGFLIAVKETWELSERYEWPMWVFFVLVVAVAAVCLTYTATQMAQSDRMVADEEKVSA